MKLPKEGADGFPNDGFDCVARRVIVQGPKVIKGLNFAVLLLFAIFFFKKRSDNFILYFAYSLLGMIRKVIFMVVNVRFDIIQ